jgi:hypothetical protein
MSFETIVFGFIGLAVVILVIRIVFSVRNGTFKSSKPADTSNHHFTDHSTGGGGDGG